MEINYNAEARHYLTEKAETDAFEDMDERAQAFWERIASDTGFHERVFEEGRLEVGDFLDGITNADLEDLTLREVQQIESMWEELEPYY